MCAPASWPLTQTVHLQGAVPGQPHPCIPRAPEILFILNSVHILTIPPVAEPLSLLPSPHPLHPFSTLQPDRCFKRQVRSHRAPVLKPSSAFTLLLEHNPYSSCCREDPLPAAPCSFCAVFPCQSPLPVPSPSRVLERDLFRLPAMFFPQPSTCSFLLIFHVL